MGTAFTNSVGYETTIFGPVTLGFGPEGGGKYYPIRREQQARLAALANLRSSATVTNTEGAPRSLANICEFHSQRLVRLWGFSNTRFTFTLVLEDTSEQGRKPRCSFP